MSGMRMVGAASVSILASYFGMLVACSDSPDPPKDVSVAQAVSAASVSIALFDENGTRVGDASGVLVAPRLVLTAGHAISGKTRWKVTSADGKQTVSSSRGLTYDWRRYDSDKAHPRKHDVGVIQLDQPITLSSYPALVAQPSTQGAKSKRMRRNGDRFETIDATLDKVRSAPHSWLVDTREGETLDTGGGVFDDKGIIGVVSGRGTTTGKLYVARVDDVVTWLAPKLQCAGSAMKSRTFAPPAIDKSVLDCDDAGIDGASTVDTSTDGGSPNGVDHPGNEGNGGPSGPEAGTLGPFGDRCSEDNDGLCSGSACLEVGRGATPVKNGSPPGSAGDDTPIHASSPVSTSNDAPVKNGSPPGSAGQDGTNDKSGSPKGGGGADVKFGGADAKFGGAHPSVDIEVCQGSSDSPEVCPPESDDCVGPSCGGGAPDDSIDYGNCACSSSNGSVDPHVR